ncbi:MAG TPA: MaoC family dehydratase [Pyrinomonadaceae bacterium]|nr:MaoC family dehydratase [Pyrinomonadaceae bacterium]
MDLKPGDTAEITKTVTDDDIRKFADLIGDDNSVHLDDEYAAKTRFGRRIAHGMIGASLVSAVLGTRLPGPGTIYLSQTLKFTAPVYPGDEVTARATVKNVKEGKPVVTLETVCKNQRGETVLTGEAVVLVEQVG